MEFDPSRDDGVTARQKAQLRWQAIEAFNSIHGLSAMSRRVGMALICTMDGKTGECFPSELGLATRLGVHLVSIKKAKAQLRELGLINWTNPGGPRHVSHYVFNWAVLYRCAAATNKHAKEVVRESRLARHKSNTEAMNERWGLNNAPRAVGEGDHSMVVKTPATGSQISSQGSLEASSMVAPRLPDITHGTAHINKLTHAEHAKSRADLLTLGSVLAASEWARPRRSDATELSPTLPCHFPVLRTCFKHEAEILVLIATLGFDAQDEVARILSQQGKDAARKVIIRRSRP
ncbi:MAG: helix-turn-helix domain-containing protein [Aestuariivirga sp.]